jgi:hypothetical protein
MLRETDKKKKEPKRGRNKPLTATQPHSRPGIGEAGRRARARRPRSYAGASLAVQRCGSRSSTRLAGWVCTRVSTSVRYAIGSMPCFSHEATSV